MTEVSTTLTRKNGEVITISAAFEDELAAWLMTQPFEIRQDFVLSEYRNNNIARAEARHTQSLDASLDHGYAFLAENDDPIDRIMRECRAQSVRNAIAKLTPEQQWLVEQLFYKQRTEVDVAAELGVTQSAIAHRMQTILRRLKKYLKKF